MKTATLPLAVLLLSGCGAQVAAILADEWQVTVEQEAGSDLRLVDYMPADGIVGVAHRSNPYFLFNRPLSAAEEADVEDLVLTEVGGDGRFSFPPEVAFDDAAVRYGEDRLNRPDAYTIDVRLPTPGDAFHSSFATDEAPGLDYNLASDMSVAAFGGNADNAATLGSYFTPELPIWLGKVTGLGSSLPATVDFALAVADGSRTSSRPLYIHRQYGYITRFEGLVIDEDGRFEQRLDGAFLPLWISGDPVLLRLTPITIRGRFELSGADAILSDFELEGVVSTRWLLKMASLEDPWPRLLDILSLDVDLNGNGIEDSATIHLVSQPVMVSRDLIDFG